MKKTKTWSLDELIRMFDLPSFDSLQEENLDYIADAGFQAAEEAKREHLEEYEYDSEEEKAEALEEIEEEARIEGSDEALDELHGKWHNAVTAAIEQTIDEIGLDLVPQSSDRYPYQYDIAPQKSWEASARALAQLIEGVGLTAVSPEEYEDPEEFVRTRFGWVTQYSEVYGGSSPERIFERNFD